MPAGSPICRGFKEYDLIMCAGGVESLSCCFPRARELVSFDPRHMTRFPPIGKRIWVGRYNNICCFPGVYLLLTILMSVMRLDHEFRHNIVKVAVDQQATLTILW